MLQTSTPPPELFPLRNAPIREQDVEPWTRSKYVRVHSRFADRKANLTTLQISTHNPDLYQLSIAPIREQGVEPWKRSVFSTLFRPVIKPLMMKGMRITPENGEACLAKVRMYVLMYRVTHWCA
jgi:hypothetical protein